MPVTQLSKDTIQLSKDTDNSDLKLLAATVTTAVYLVGLGYFTWTIDRKNRESTEKVQNSLLAKHHLLLEPEIRLSIPQELISNPEEGRFIDITSVREVSTAMNVSLSGKKNQVLFSIEINNQKLTVTVEMLPQIAKIINILENALISPDGKKSIGPENFRQNSQSSENTSPTR